MLHVQSYCDHFEASVHILQSQSAETKIYLKYVHLGFRQCILIPDNRQNMAETCIIHY